MLREIRAWWARRKKHTQDKYTADHQSVSPTDLEKAQRNFEYRTTRQPRR